MPLVPTNHDENQFLPLTPSQSETPAQYPSPEPLPKTSRTSQEKINITNVHYDAKHQPFYKQEVATLRLNTSKQHAQDMRYQSKAFNFNTGRS